MKTPAKTFALYTVAAVLVSIIMFLFAVLNEAEGQEHPRTARATANTPATATIQPGARSDTVTSGATVDTIRNTVNYK